ncbi:phosphoenolpyruvate-dependent sugar phosphotransferase system eiia 2 [Lucifera butyrica]|uniref:Phosphoenolpyruvate-dependent sugar phosphotransferase system eiia 2 n=1 Tax=Lucifera butyrica TaxID=1351585 RepID=A0A498R8Z3_9FIRM|nr:PTS sugar transporter subunit IIA [Lucifera butyrica]VBB07465.1 phosphoenolpyruvate-dependent sugar phosphotransferase system eiia 2 [Lucifera butyrica]
MLDTVLSKEFILIPLEADTKQAAIYKLAARLHENGRLNDLNAFLQAVWEREKEYSTVLNDGIVIPHAKTNTVKQASIAVGISKKGIDCGAEDNNLSRFFFLLAAPDDADAIHIRNLSKLSCLLLEEEIRESLLRANSAAEILAILKQDR